MFFLFLAIVLIAARIVYLCLSMSETLSAVDAATRSRLPFQSWSAFELKTQTTYSHRESASAMHCEPEIGRRDVVCIRCTAPM